MTVTAVQIGLDPDVIDCSSSDFAQFPGLSKEKLRAANDENVAALRAAGRHVDNCLVNAAHIAQPGCRFVFNRAAVATPDDIRRWYPNPEAVA
jgi:hypothetical protein